MSDSEWVNGPAEQGRRGHPLQFGVKQQISLAIKAPFLPPPTTPILAAQVLAQHDQRDADPHKSGGQHLGEAHLCPTP